MRTLVHFVSSRGLATALVIGIVIRGAIFPQTSELGARIFDERQYVQLATSLLRGHGYAWASGQPTSLRPPLYPAMVAAIWSAGGDGNLQAVRVVQFGLGLLTAVLAFELGRRTFNRRVGALAFAAVWLYPTLIFLNFTILTETLFTLLLVAFALLTVMLVQRPRASTAVAAGVTLGMGALTRSVLWPVPLVLCPLLALLLVRSARGFRMPSRSPDDGRQVTMRAAILLPVLVLVGYGAIVAPWSVRNTRLQGVTTIVDTMGGLNLRMGNYEHTPEDRMWDAVSLSGTKNWVYDLTLEKWDHVPTEGEKDKWAQRKAIEYMTANPAITLRRAVIKFADFWSLERTYIAGWQQGLYRPARWFALLSAGAITVSYVGVALFAMLGIWLTRPEWRVHVLMLLPVLTVAAAHTLTFGHPRYHVPLVPILAVYGAAFAESGLRKAWTAPASLRYAAVFTILALIGIWLRQSLVELDRIRGLLS